MTKKIKTKRRRGILIKCYSCPISHDGWLRSKLRYRQRVPRCPRHLQEYDEKHKSWPICPQCKSDTDFGTMTQQGSVKNIRASCDECGFECLATDYFDERMIRFIVDPIIK